jgi:hypothetical protein
MLLFDLPGEKTMSLALYMQRYVSFQIDIFIGRVND